MEGKNAGEDAPRLSRPGWKDPRLLAGMLLVLLSVAGIVALVQSLDRSDGYWAASQDLVPGDVVGPDQLTVVQARLGGATDDYLPATEPFPEGTSVEGTVRQGELVPARAVADVDPQSRQAVSVTVPDPLPDGTDAGSRVDVWIAETDGNQGFEEPELVAPAAELAQVSEATGSFGATGEVTMQLLLGPEELPKVLDAKGNGARISVVPSLVGQ
ncbi:flagellar biosynthesis protein FlgA [Citricoccus sp. GCM10030269]|uniref:flagellar biosynthesis protein FlgA n=1 Tax=Citricoccus sp. GCM10030269 TaxID=3273388 RepID=UPI0036088597